MVCNILKRNNVEYFTYTTEQEKGLTMVHENSEGYDIEIVFDELQQKMENFNFKIKMQYTKTQQRRMFYLHT